MAKNILIVGGGLSGTIVANGLCRQLSKELRDGKVGITLLGTSDQHLYQPGLLYVPSGAFARRSCSATSERFSTAASTSSSTRRGTSTSMPAR